MGNGGIDQVWRAKEVARLLSMVEAERRYYQEILAGLPEALAVVAADGSLALANRGFRRMFSLGALAGSEVMLAEAAPVAGLEEAAAAVLAGGGARMFEARHGDRDLRLWVRPYADWDESAERQAIVVVEDVTAAAERERNRLGSLPAVVWRMDPRTMTFQDVAAGTPENLGLPPGLWRQGARFWSERIDASDLPRVEAAFQAGMEGAPLNACEYRAPGAAGQTLRLRDVLRFVRDEEGTVTSVEGLTIDVTASRRIAESAERAARADAAARVSARVAHEANNLLTVLGGFGEELLHALPADSALRVNVLEVLHAGDRLSGLVAGLVPMTTRPVIEPRPVLAAPLLSRVCDRMRVQAPPGVEVRLEAPGEDVAMVADGEFVERLMVALGERAARGMTKGGRISIAVRQEAIGETWAGEPRQGDRVVIEVRDNGIAIHGDALERIFEPYPAEGAGGPDLAPLYLSTLDGGGDLRVTSAHGKGTVFEISFPKATAAEAIESGPLAKAWPAPAPQVVLVVEDEPGIRTLIRKTLQRSGFQVLEAPGGADALRIARSHEGRIDLLLTDVVMPEIGGVELAAAVGDLRRGLKVLFVSGYAGPTDIDLGAFAAGAAFLQKPFTLAALLAKVKELLGSRDANRASA